MTGVSFRRPHEDSETQGGGGAVTMEVETEVVLEAKSHQGLLAAMKS